MANRKAGKWVKNKAGGDQCSLCGFHCSINVKGREIPLSMSDFRYCPLCGAKMAQSNEVKEAKTK